VPFREVRANEMNDCFADIAWSGKAKFLNLEFGDSCR